MRWLDFPGCTLETENPLSRWAGTQSTGKLSSTYLQICVDLPRVTYLYRHPLTHLPTLTGVLSTRARGFKYVKHTQNWISDQIRGGLSYTVCRR